MHLLSMVADRLWLVSDGTVAPYDGDLDSYREMLLMRDKPARKADAKAASKPKPKRASRDQILALRNEVRKAEARIEKLTEMQDKLDEKLADPEIYESCRAGDRAVWQKKHAECMDALDRAEELWMKALEKLEVAEAQ